MKTHASIMESADATADYINSHVSAFPEHLKPLALAAVRSMSPVERVVKGMELLYAVARSEHDEDAGDLLDALHSNAMQVAEGGFWGKGDRAVSIAKFARHEAGEWTNGVPAPAEVDIDPEYVKPAPQATVTEPETPASPETPPSE